MHQLLNGFADKRELLPRSISEIYENLQQFHVAEKGRTIIGTCALYVTWDNLAEVKALAVDDKFQGQGIGKTLLEAVIRMGETLGIQLVATGVETLEQRNALRRLGCELGQGTLLSPAVNASGALEIAVEHARTTPPGA